MAISDFRFWIVGWRRAPKPCNRNSIARNLKSTLAGLALLLITQAGCGYTMSADPDSDVGPPRTVRLETVENRLMPPRPGLEYELTDRLKEEIATNRRLILSEGAAEVHLKVSLIRFVEPTQVEDLKTGKPVEITLRATAVVEASGEHYRGGRERRTVTRSVSYVPEIGDSRREGLERLWRDLAREILDVATDEWAQQP